MIGISVPSGESHAVRVNGGVLVDSEEDKEPKAREERRSVAIRGLAMLEDGSTQAVTILDLSYDGCGIQTPVPLQPGDTVRLSIHRRGVIDAEVRWYSGAKAGLVFTPAPEPTEPAAGKVPRENERVTLTAQIAMQRSGRRVYSVTAKDVSPSGCKVAFVDRPEVDERVWIAFDGLETLDARVRWIEGQEAGIAFDRPIHPAVFQLLLERLSAQSR